jgi:hypothetical protein
MSVFSRARIPSITDREWDLAAGLFRQKGAAIGPARLRIEAGLKREVACSLLLGIFEEGQADLSFLVYHDCSEHPVNERKYIDGFQPVPWRCPECEQLVTNENELRYELRAILRAPIEFG